MHEVIHHRAAQVQVRRDTRGIPKLCNHLRSSWLGYEVHDQTIQADTACTELLRGHEPARHRQRDTPRASEILSCPYRNQLVRTRAQRTDQKGLVRSDALYQ
jgi:hypothetical protein